MSIIKDIREEINRRLRKSILGEEQVEIERKKGEKEWKGEISIGVYGIKQIYAHNLYPNEFLPLENTTVDKIAFQYSSWDPKMQKYGKMAVIIGVNNREVFHRDDALVVYGTLLFKNFKDTLKMFGLNIGEPSEFLYIATIEYDGFIEINTEHTPDGVNLFISGGTYKVKR